MVEFAPDGPRIVLAHPIILAERPPDVPGVPTCLTCVAAVIWFLVKLRSSM
jgi:hypothetical protein